MTSHGDVLGAVWTSTGMVHLRVCASTDNVGTRLLSRILVQTAAVGSSSLHLMTSRPTAAKAAGAAPPQMAGVKREDTPCLDEVGIITPARKRLRFGTPAPADPEAGPGDGCFYGT